MRIIDSHHHLWDSSAHHYPLLAGPMHERGWGDWSALRANYLVSDFLADARNQDLWKSVHVQANFDPTNPVGETAWLDRVATQPESRGFPHGIVAFANLADPQVDQVLEGHARYPRVRGIRQVLNRHPDPVRNRAEHDWLAEPLWRDNLGKLRAFGWSFDVQVYHHQMADVATLARRYDDMQFILDHAGMPTERDAQGVQAWRKGMQMLAECPNVAVKLSGYGMGDLRWTTASIRPFVLEPIEWFGTERAMFGSNFPIDRLMADYDKVWNAYLELTGDFSDDERARLFHANAQRIYRL
jgi:predicted TIM-barrel fold metal-dependent hydrolase